MHIDIVRAICVSMRGVVGVLHAAGYMGRRARLPCMNRACGAAQRGARGVAAARGGGGSRGYRRAAAPAVAHIAMCSPRARGIVVCGARAPGWAGALPLRWLLMCTQRTHAHCHIMMPQRRRTPVSVLPCFYRPCMPLPYTLQLRVLLPTLQAQCHLLTPRCGLLHVRYPRIHRHVQLPLHP